MSFELGGLIGLSLMLLDVSLRRGGYLVWSVRIYVYTCTPSHLLNMYDAYCDHPAPVIISF